MNFFMPIIIPYNQKNDYTNCPKCGHQWIEEDTSENILVPIIVFISLFIFLVWFIRFFIVYSGLTFSEYCKESWTFVWTGAVKFFNRLRR